MDENKAPVRKQAKKQKKMSESFLLNFGLKAILGFVVIILFLTSVQCSIEKPEAPTWNTNFTVPLINRVYPMDEIIRKIDQPGLYIDSSGDVMFAYDASMDTISVDDNLSVPGYSSTISEEIGLLDLSLSNPPEVSILPTDLGFALENITIPSVWLDTMKIFVDPIQEFSWADIETDTIYATVANDFGVDIDTTIILLFDNVSGVLLASEVYDQVIPADAVPVNIPIEIGGRITNDFKMFVVCHTPGGSSLSLSGKSISCGMDIGDGITVTRALADVPQVDLDFSDKFGLDSDNSIMGAELESGTLTLAISNYTNLDANINLTLPDITNGSSPISTSTLATANSTTMINLDLHGYTFAPATDDSITIQASASTAISPTMKIIDQTDNIQVVTTMSNLTFSSMTGIISTTTIDFDESVDLDLPDGFDSLQLLGAQLELEIISGINFPGALNLILQGDNGRQVLIPSTNIISGSYNNPSATTILLTDLDDFLNPVPTSITVAGQAAIGDGVTQGTVTNMDFIASNISISSPLQFKLVGQPTFAADTSSEEIDQEDIDKITDHLISATLNSTVINTLPIGVNVRIMIDPDSLQLNETEADFIRELEVDPSSSSPVSLSLDSLDVKVLENPYIYITQDITLIGSDSAVSLTTNDSILVQGVINVEYRFDGEF